MAREVINVGSSPNDGTGDPLRTAYQKCNSNFGELYSRYQETVPTSSLGTVGDSKGMYAADDTYFYFCHTDYDGSTNIWLRVSGSTF